MFTKVHKTNEITMQKTIYNHLYNMMVVILAKNGRYLTPGIKQAIHQTAQADIQRMISDNTLKTYYERLKKGQI